MRPYLLLYLPCEGMIRPSCLGYKTGTRTDFDMGEELLSLIYLVLLYYVLVVLIKSKFLRKFLKLFYDTLLVYISDIYRDIPIEKKSKKAINLNFFRTSRTRIEYSNSSSFSLKTLFSYIFLS